VIIDSELVRKCLEGKRRAYNSLYEKLYSYLMNVCIRYNNNYDEAEASANEIFLRIIINLKQYNSQKSILPWVKTIAINYLTDEFRKSKTQKNSFLMNEDMAPFENEVSTIKIEGLLEAKDLLKMVQSLPTACRKIFNLYAIDGYTHKEIAEMLLINEGTSKTQLHIARFKLQKMIEDEQNKIKATQFEKSR
jgi:RNA polymerase sigma factor (sigma-70 family)